MNQSERLDPIVSTYRAYFGKEAHTIWDCGTRDGEDAKYLADALSAQIVIAIDANPIAVDATKQAYPEFRVIHKALLDYDGQCEFTQIISDRADHAGSSSIIRTQNFAGASYHTITVPAARMETLIESQFDAKLDVIKVDLEGFTYEFLIGMGRYLKQAKVLHLETEVFQRHDGHKNSQQVKDFMTNAGFELIETSYEWGPHIEDQLWVNAPLAVD